MITSEAMHVAELADADLVAESLNGDRDAFGQIVERYQTLVASLAFCATGNVTESEDLAQETFLAAWKRLSELREPEKLRPWLCSITRFLVGKVRRRQGREPVHDAQSLDSLDEWSSPEPLPPEQAISQEELGLLWRSLERIPPAYREPLVLYYREHQSIEAVAAGLGLSEDAVKQRLSRGRKFLQEQFMAFVAGALDRTRPDKTFAAGVLAALPLAAATAKGASVGTALAKHGSVAAKTTASGGFLQALSTGFVVMIYWLNAAILPLAGYIGYKMGGDSQNSERVRRSVATFWRTIGIGIFLLLFFPLLLAVFLAEVLHLPEARLLPLLRSVLNICLPAYMFGIVPLSLVAWLWQRRRTTAVVQATSGEVVRPKRVGIWVGLAMSMATLYLGFLCWTYGLALHMHLVGKSLPETRSLSIRELQNVVADAHIEKSGIKLYQNVSGGRTLSGDLLENGKITSFVAPADTSTLALLKEKHIGYDTTIAGRDGPPLPSRAFFEAQRLLEPLSCFILVAGTVTLLRGRQDRKSTSQAGFAPANERRVDLAFALVAACIVLAIAFSIGWKTDWRVRRISADQVAQVVGEHPKSRFAIYESFEGSRSLWISDRRTPDFIAPATDSALALLSRQGITPDVRVASYIAGKPGYLGRTQFSATLWILSLAAGSAGLVWWGMRRRTHCPLSGTGGT